MEGMRKSQRKRLKLACIFKRGERFKERNIKNDGLIGKRISVYFPYVVVVLKLNELCG